MMYDKKAIGQIAVEFVKAEDYDEIDTTTLVPVIEAAWAVGISLVKRESEDDTAITTSMGKVYIPVGDEASEFDLACHVGAYLLFEAALNDLLEDNDKMRSVYEFAAYCLLPWLIDGEVVGVSSMLAVAHGTEIPFMALREIYS